MKKWIMVIAMLAVCMSTLHAQDEEPERKGFRKENLFTGGSISLSFFGTTFLVGASPVLGYKIADWMDAGVVINFQYSSTRDYNFEDDRLRQTLYGGGLFTRIYPFPFLFGQVQGEHNFIALKYKAAPGSGYINDSRNTSVTSLLVGAGYAQGRIPGVNSGSFYISLLWDVGGNKNSPYTDNRGRPVPIIRAGVNVPLFQGGRGGGY